MNEETKHILQKGAIIMMFAFFGGLIGGIFGCRCHCMGTMQHIHLHSGHMPHMDFFDYQKAMEHKMKKFFDKIEKKTPEYKGEIIEEDYIVIPRRFLETPDNKGIKPFNGPRPENKR